MKKAIVILVLLLVIAIAVLMGKIKLPRHGDPPVAKFQEEAENLIMGLQQYKEFVGSYPTGENLDISRAMSGQTEKKVLILTVRKSEQNAKGEIVDPWGTPIQFYFSKNGVLVRSAGPNKIWEDNSVSGADDLFRTN